jgi:hypothetical protein
MLDAKWLYPQQKATLHDLCDVQKQIESVPVSPSPIPANLKKKEPF